MASSTRGSTPTTIQFQTALKQLVDRWRYSPTLLFEKKTDYVEGLNATTINELACSLGTGPVFENVIEPGYRLLRLNSAEPEKQPIVWTVWSNGERWSEFITDWTAVAHERTKFLDSLDYLESWKKRFGEKRPSRRGAKRKPLTEREQRAIGLWECRDPKEIPDYASLKSELKKEKFEMSVSEISRLFNRIQHQKRRSKKPRRTN